MTIKPTTSSDRRTPGKKKTLNHRRNLKKDSILTQDAVAEDVDDGANVALLLDEQSGELDVFHGVATEPGDVL